MKLLLFSGLIFLLKAPHHTFLTIQIPSTSPTPNPIFWGFSGNFYPLAWAWGRYKATFLQGWGEGKPFFGNFPSPTCEIYFPLPPVSPGGTPVALGEPILAVELHSSCLFNLVVCSEHLSWVTLAALAPFVKSNKFNAEISRFFFFLLPSPFPFLSFLSMSDEPVEMLCAYGFPVWLALM